ncbi:phospholipid scramblase 1 [Entophlyctis luteolus]|nr:phospholipid scramblase 1 [Entophlyctis luteolus]
MTLLLTFFPDVTDPLPFLAFTSDAFGGTAGALTFVFDTIMLFAFVKFIRATKLDNEDADRRFILVAKYGSLAVGFGYVSIMFFVMAVVVEDSFLSEAMWNAVFASLTCVNMVLVSMKAAISRLESKRMDKTPSGSFSLDTVESAEILLLNADSSQLLHTPSSLRQSILTPNHPGTRISIPEFTGGLGSHSTGGGRSVRISTAGTNSIIDMYLGGSISDGSFLPRDFGGTVESFFDDAANDSNVQDSNSGLVVDFSVPDDLSPQELNDSNVENLISDVRPEEKGSKRKRFRENQADGGLSIAATQKKRSKKRLVDERTELSNQEMSSLRQRASAALFEADIAWNETNFRVKIRGFAETAMNRFSFRHNDRIQNLYRENMKRGNFFANDEVANSMIKRTRTETEGGRVTTDRNASPLIDFDIEFGRDEYDNIHAAGGSEGAAFEIVSRISVPWSKSHGGSSLRSSRSGMILQDANTNASSGGRISLAQRESGESTGPLALQDTTAASIPSRANFPEAESDGSNNFLLNTSSSNDSMILKGTDNEAFKDTGESFAFLDYAKAHAEKQGSGSVYLSDLVGGLRSRAASSQAFYHILYLATRGFITVNQTRAYADIRLNFDLAQDYPPTVPPLPKLRKSTVRQGSVQEQLQDPPDLVRRRSELKSNDLDYTQLDIASSKLYINLLLSDDRDLHKSNHLPIPKEPRDSIFEACRDGRLINYAVPGSVDESKLYANPKHVVQRAENLQIMLQGAVAAGVRVVNIGPNDILSNNPTPLLGLIWQIIKMCQAVDSQDLLTRLAAALAALKDRDAEIAVLRAQLSAVTAAAGTTTPNGQSKEVGAALHATSAASNSVVMNTEAQVACCDASERMQQLQRENAKLVELSSQLAASLQSLEAAVIVSDPDLARRRSLGVSVDTVNSQLH